MPSVGIAILARDEERCIARCLDSVTGRGFADVLVVDTGSRDRTTDIATGYREVRLDRLPWPDSFAAVRNHAIDAIDAERIVFVDADEWLSPEAAARLSTLPDGEVFAPRIRDTHHETVALDVPRVVHHGIRYRGPVHEYVVHADGTPVEVIRLDLEFQHDGYRPDVAHAKRKRRRNLDLLDTAIAAEPDNPRWLCFRVRDAGGDIAPPALLDLCARIHDLIGAETRFGDTYDALHYYRVAVGSACRALLAVGERDAVLRLCETLNAVARDDPDAHYLAAMTHLADTTATDRDLLRSITIRENPNLIATSAIDPSGRHLDALIGLQLELRRGRAEADRYRELCAPWTDGFFVDSRPRTAT